MGKISSPLANLKEKRRGAEGISVSRGRQRMMVSIYISVWLRTWARDKRSDNILRARKIWTSAGGVIKVSKVGGRNAFGRKVVTKWGS